MINNSLNYQMNSGDDRRVGCGYLYDPPHHGHHCRVLFTITTCQGIHHWWSIFP